MEDETICVYCGQEKPYKNNYQGYEWEYVNTTYFPCNCYDAVKAREIDKTIKDLESQKPKPKYKIIYDKKVESISIV